MKKIIPYITTLLFYLPLQGQITLTTDYFPVAGDTLRIATAENPDIDLLQPDGNVTWDFTNLVGPVFESIVLDASEGIAFSTFPNATTMLGQSGVAEQYFRSTSSIYEMLGFSGADPVGIGLDIIFKNNPPIIERRAPLSYPDVNTQSSSVMVAYAWADLPAIVTDSLGGELPVTPDSVGVEVFVDILENVDAWGTVQLPMGDYEVLRVRNRTIRETRLKAFVPIFGWQDVSGLVPNDLLGIDTTLNYRFFSNDSKEEIVIVTVDPINEAILNVQFKANNSTTNIIELHNGRASIHAYPNPAITDVRFDVVNITSGKYQLKIYNILGIEVWNKSYSLVGQQDTIRINLYDFKKGTYLYSLVDEFGRPIVTRRLMIIRP